GRERANSGLDSLALSGERRVLMSRGGSDRGESRCPPRMYKTLGSPASSVRRTIALLCSVVGLTAAVILAGERVHPLVGSWKPEVVPVRNAAVAPGCSTRYDGVRVELMPGFIAVE